MKRIAFLVWLILLLPALSFAGPFFSGGGASSSSGDVATDTIWDAAGDLAVGSGANTAARMAHPGAANYILYSNAATTIAWLASSANMISLLGSADYATARTNLGLAIGVNVQAYDADLTSWAAITAPTVAAAGDIVVGSAANALTVITKGANNSLFGVNTSGTLGFYTNIKSDDSDAQFYSATASKGTAQVRLSGSTNGKKTILDFVHTNDRTITFPDATDTLVGKATTDTLTNKTLTTPAITSLEVLIDCNGSADPYAYCTSANASTLTATHTSRTIINSYGRGEAQTVTLPAAATGMTFIAIVGTQHNSAWKIQRAGSDTITWSSGGTDTTGKTYFQETNQAVGSRVSCITYKTGASAWSWLCGSVTGTWVTD